MFLATNCTGIKLENNCMKNVKRTVTVLPFLDDDYDCNRNIEKILAGMCYEIIDGRTLLNEYSIATRKNFDDISFDEFSDFAKSRGVDLVVYGSAKIVWHDPSNIYASDQNSGVDGYYGRSKYDAIAMKQFLKGNYATVDCFAFDTQTKEKIAIFKNYKVKKINLGQPEFVRQ